MGASLSKVIQENYVTSWWVIYLQSSNLLNVQCKLTQRTPHYLTRRRWIYWMGVASIFSIVEERFPVTIATLVPHMIPVSASVIWGELPSFWAKYNCCIEWGVHFVNVFNLYCILYLAGMKKSGNYTACVPCTVLITNAMNWAECAFIMYL